MLGTLLLRCHHIEEYGYDGAPELHLRDQRDLSQVSDQLQCQLTVPLSCTKTEMKNKILQQETDLK